MNRTQHILLFIVLLTSSVLAYAQTPEQEHILDSLRRIYNESDDDMVKLEAVDAITYRHYSSDSTEYYAKLQIKLANKTNNKYFEAKALDYLAWASFFYGDYPKACEYTFDALFIADSIGDKGLKANNYYMLGNSYSKMQNMTKSNEYFYKALDIYYEHKDSSHICDVFRNIANNNCENSLYEAAENCLMQSMSINCRRNDKIGLSEDNYYLAKLAYKRYSDHKISDPKTDQLKLAKNHLSEARRYAREAQFGFSQLKSAQQMAFVMTELADLENSPKAKNELLDSCLLLINEAYDLCDKIGSFDERLNVDETYAYWLIERGQYGKVEVLVDSIYSMLSAANELNSSGIQRFSLVQAKLYSEMGQYSKACYYKDLYHEMYCDSKQSDYIAQTAQNMAQTNFDQKLRAREVYYENESKMQRTITLAVASMMVLAIFAGFFVVASNVKSRKINRILDNKNIILKRQKIEIENQKKNLEQQNSLITSANREMTESINYASIIQKSVMPSYEQMEAIFGENMVVYKPLDIVSGDFYWATQVGKIKMLAAADCTGHGVPGAILSMLGISTLNDISSRLDENNFSTGVILDEMRSTIKRSLKQNGGDEDNHDGIDMSIIAIDTEKMIMHYSGAYRPILLIRDGTDTTLAYDRMPIGTHYKEAQHFKENIIEIAKGDMIYMFSDGITDQFGYTEEHEETKFGMIRLYSLLKNIYDKPLYTQKTMVEMAIDSWRHDDGKISPYSQTDDALLVGIKV